MIPGCIRQGDTRAEALASIRDAITLGLANQPAEAGDLAAAKLP